MKTPTPFILLFALVLAENVKSQETNLNPGLQAEYFDLSADWLPFPKVYEDLTPVVERAAPAINFEAGAEPIAPGVPRDFFVARWDGWIKIPANGTYTFYLESDDGARLYLDGRLKLNHDGLHKMAEKAESIELASGDHEIQIELFDFTSVAGCKLSWSFGNGPKEIVPASNLFHRVSSTDEPQPGLMGKYFDLLQHWKTFPRIDPFQAPAIKRVESVINFDEASNNWPDKKLEDFFAIHWKGRIRIPKEGDYTFHLASDDGSRLFLGDREVISNGGNHGVREKSTQVNLSQGDHDIMVEFFDIMNTSSCRLFWESAEIAREIIPPSAFFHDETGKSSPGVISEIKPVETSLKVWLRFDESDIAMADDASGNGNSAALSGDPIPSTTGKVGGCLNFDGIDDYGKLPAETFDLTGGLTVALWANPASMKGWARFIDFGNGPGTNNIIFARRSTSNDLYLQTFDGTATRGQIKAEAALEFGVWQHLAFTVDSGGKAVVYKNGVAVAEGGTVIGRKVLRASNWIGRSNWERDKLFDGALDDLRVYERVLTAEEIGGLAQVTPKE